MASLAFRPRWLGRYSTRNAMAGSSARARRSGGDVTREKRDEGQGDGEPGEGHRIELHDSEEQAHHGLPGSIGEEDLEDDADGK